MLPSHYWGKETKRKDDVRSMLPKPEVWSQPDIQLDESQMCQIWKEPPRCRMKETTSHSALCGEAHSANYMRCEHASRLRKVAPGEATPVMQSNS